MAEFSDAPSSLTCDVAIVGAGVLGLSIAYEIARRRLNLRVAVIRQAAIFGAASQAAGAMLSGFGETTTLTLATDAGRAKAEWRLQAAELWPAWSEGLNETAPDSPVRLHDGTLVIINSVSGPLDERNLAALVAFLRSRDVPFEDVATANVGGLRPSAPSRPQRAILLPDERYTDASVVLSALMENIARNDRVALVDARCTGIAVHEQNGHGHEILTGNGRILAGNVIIAAGAASLELMNSRPDVVQRIPPLLCGAGTAIVCAPPRDGPRLEVAVRTPNRSFACGLHALPGVRGGIYLGATNNVQRDPTFKPPLSDLSFLIGCATQQIDRRLQASEVLSILVGNRPVSVDTFPLLGETSIPGLWLATGTYRDGFLLSPLIATRMVDALESGNSHLSGAEIFRPERPPLASAPSIPVAIAEGIENYIAIAFERGAVLPQVGHWEDAFRDEITRRVEAIYSNFGSRFILPPDMLWDIEQGKLGSIFETYYAEAERMWN